MDAKKLESFYFFNQYGKIVTNGSVYQCLFDFQNYNIKVKDKLIKHAETLLNSDKVWRR